MCHQFYSEIYGLCEQMGVAGFSGTESKKYITTSDIKISHNVNHGEDADKVSSVFQGETFDKCNVKFVINSTNCNNMQNSALFCYIL